MRSIYLYGQMLTVSAAYMQLDALMHRHHVRNVAFAMASSMTEEVAQALRQGGAEIWLCVPSESTELPLDTARPDRLMTAASWHELAAKVSRAFHAFMGSAPVPT